MCDSESTMIADKIPLTSIPKKCSKREKVKERHRYNYRTEQTPTHPLVLAPFGAQTPIVRDQPYTHKGMSARIPILEGFSAAEVPCVLHHVSSGASNQTKMPQRFDNKLR